MSKLLVLALAACSSAQAESDRPNFTPYSCDGIAAGPQYATVDPTVVAPWRALLEDHRTDDLWVRRVHVLALTRLPTTLGIDERVRLQHVLLGIARRTDVARRQPDAAAAKAAHGAVMSLIRATAPTAGELATLGEGVHPEVEPILGLSITERATKTCAGGNSIHVRKSDGLLAFRPLRSGTTRALVAQIVAFDTDGHPHVTPLVEGMELRLGNELSSPACVIQSRPDGTLYPAAHAEIEEHAPFVHRQGEGVSCVNCHYQPNAMNARDLTADEARTIDIARTDQVERLADDVWKSISR
jgi:hypothetical protein